MRARDLIRQVCAAREVKILKGHVGRDHVHLMVSIPPVLSVSHVMQYVKGKGSRMLLQEFSELEKRYWGQHLWARGYFCASSGTVTDEMVKASTASQDVPPDDGFRVADEKLSRLQPNRRRLQPRPVGFQPRPKPTGFSR